MRNSEIMPRTSDDAAHRSVQLWTTRQVAEYIARPERTLAQWRYLGRGPRYISIEHGHVRYRAADVEAWLAAQTMTPGGDAACTRL